MMLQQHETAQLRPKVAGDPGRHRRGHRPTVRRLPTFTADAHDVRAQLEILEYLGQKAGRLGGR